MADLINFKVFLTRENAPEGSKPEIRRLGIDFDVVTNFTYLREKLQSVYPDLKGRRFTVSWRDSEDDDIIISSCEELQIALTETQNFPVRKLYVTLHSNYDEEKSHPSTSSHSTTNQKMKHIGIVCDGCDKNVQGYRYKCLQCSDYDLCSDCEAKGLHPEHCMIRISVPLQWRSHYGKRLSHHINKFMKKASACSPEEEPKECPFKNRKHSNVWIDTFTTYLNDWANLPGECQFSESDKTKKTNSEQTYSKPGPSSEKSYKDSHIEFLKNIGENISQFLDPLGIDVNVQVKTDMPTATTEKENQTEKTDDLEMHNKNGNSATYNKNAESTVHDIKNDHITINKLIEFASKQHPNEINKSKQGEASSTLLLDSEKKQGNQLINQIRKSKVDDWTLIEDENFSFPVPVDSETVAVSETLNKEKSGKLIQDESKVSDEQKLYPSLPNVSDNVWHSKDTKIHPKIQRALEAMMQMGFSNEGGWLTQLLVAKNGDISKVLDVLQPVRE